MLLVGIPPVNRELILGGGTLVFVATVLLVRQLAAMAPRINKQTAVTRAMPGESSTSPG